MAWKAGTLDPKNPLKNDGVPVEVPWKILGFCVYPGFILFRYRIPRERNPDVFGVGSVKIFHMKGISYISEMGSKQVATKLLRNILYWLYIYIYIRRMSRIVPVLIIGSLWLMRLLFVNPQRSDHRITRKIHPKCPSDPFGHLYHIAMAAMANVVRWFAKRNNGDFP